MQSGLKIAMSKLERAMDFTLVMVKGLFALVYLNDVVTFSRYVEEHLDHLQTILRLQSRAGVSLTLKK